MKVLHILKELRPSGVEVMLKLAANSWSDNCESHILAISDKAGSYTEQLMSVGYIIHQLKYRRGLGTLGSLIKYAKIIYHLKPDVVHVHSEGLSIFTTSIPAIMGCTVFRSVQNTFLYKGLTRYQKIVERFITRMLGCVYISASESVRMNEEKRLYNFSFLIWNWFDSLHFRPPTSEERLQAREKLGIGSDQTVLVTVGNGNDVKNYPAIIEAISDPSICGINDESNKVLYLMVGNEHPDRLERKAAEKFNISHGVRFCGPQSNVRDYLWASDIYLMPSHFEGFGLAAAEALACGLPCIFSLRPSLVDFKELGIEATWCNTSVHDIREAIIENLKSNLSMFCDHGKENSKIIRDLFSVHKRASEYYEKWEKYIK